MARTLSPFPPIASYAFLSDCEVCALVAPTGNVEWMCLPRFDGPSIFGALLDRDAGLFKLAPAGVTVPAWRRYLPGTMVMETTWDTPTGWLIVRDVLLIGPWHHHGERSNSHRRAPTDVDAEHVLLRMLRCVNGRVEMRMECEPRLGYGRTPVTWEYQGPGYGHGVARAEEEPLRLQLRTDLRLGFEGGRAVSRTTMREGEVAYMALGWTDHPAPASYDEAHRRLVYTADYWHEWLSQGDFPDHPWRTHLQRSALTLKGLIFAPTGAMIAAPTTSLPETPGGSRNWDYRYAWVRDSTFLLSGLYTLGFDEEADDFFYFIRDVVGGSQLQVMYGIGGERELPERTLDDLHGYAGARPVRIGNDAHRQRQHDVWGALLESIYLHTKSREGLAESTWRIVCSALDDVVAHWREPDRGIWEVRGEPKHFTSSKLMCWVACDRGARLARLREDAERAQRWQEEADAIHADVCAHGVDERGVFVQHYDTTALDAACLLIPLVRFLPPDDPRVVATVNAIADELSVDGFVRRYQTEHTDDGLVGEEGTFVMCSFWLVSALVLLGEIGRARGLCERYLCFASGLQLFAEEVDPHTGRHWGNFPQAFSHLALINAVTHVIRAEEQMLSLEQPLVHVPDNRRRGNLMDPLSPPSFPGLR